MCCTCEILQELKHDEVCHELVEEYRIQKVDEVEDDKAHQGKDHQKLAAKAVGPRSHKEDEECGGNALETRFSDWMAMAL